MEQQRHLGAALSRLASGRGDDRLQLLRTSEGLIERFKIWHAGFDGHEPWAPEKFDWNRHSRIADALAHDLKAALGPKIYVEHRELVEILPGGRTVSCRPRLGLLDEAES
jgi:hypothetical protein